MQELLARGQMVSAGGRKPRPSEAKENAELERRREEGRGWAAAMGPARPAELRGCVAKGG